MYRVSESASGKMVRKTFMEMLQLATKRHVPIIICEKIDRLTRNLKDASMVDDWVKEDVTREVHSVKETFILNCNTKAHENLVWDMKVAMARFYTNNLSEEVKKGQKEKLAQGWLPGQPPLGYKVVGEAGHRIHVPDGTETMPDGKTVLTGTAALIRQMFELYATGEYSLSRLEKAMYQAGLRTRSGRKLGISRMYLDLQEPFYYGKISWNGTLYKGSQTPLIARDVFDKVQLVLRRQTKNPHFSKHNPLFKARIHCEHCGGMLTWETQKGHWYGHCNYHGQSRSCPKKTYIREEKVAEQLVGVFERLAPRHEAVLGMIEDVIRQENAENVIRREGQITTLQGRLGALRKQKDRYFEAKIQDKAPLEYCDRKVAECVAEETELEAAMARVSDQSDTYQELRMVVHELACKSREIYEAATPEEKQLLFGEIFSNIIQDGQEIRPSLTLAAEYLLTWMPKLSADYEPQETLMGKGKTAALTAGHPVWLCLLNKIRTFYQNNLDEN